MKVSEATAVDLATGGTPADGGSSRVRRFWPLFIFSVSAATYWIIPTRDYYWDGIGFAQSIEQAHGFGPRLLHPNHLVYNVLGYCIFHAVLALGFHVRALAVLQAFNGVLASLAALLLYSQLKLLTASENAAGLLAFLFAFSATWWKFSTDADAYIASVLLLMVAAGLLLKSGRPHPIAVAVLHSSAMLVHQLAILFLPAAIYGLWRQAANSAQRPLHFVGRYLLVAALITVGVYGFAFRAVSGHFNMAGMLAWASSHSQSSSFSANLGRGVNYAIRGTIRLMLATNSIGSQHRLEELWRYALFSGIAILVVYLVWTGKAAVGPDRTALLALRFALFWIVPYLIFLLFWEPQNTFYRLFYLPALFLLLASVLQAGLRQTIGLEMLGALAVLVFALNLQFLVIPASREQNNWALMAAEQLQQRWDSDTTIFYAQEGGASIFDWTVRYFTPRAQWMHFSPDVHNLQADAESTSKQGRNIWVDTSTMEAGQRDRALGLWLAAHLVPGSEFHEKRGNYELWYAQVKP